MQLPGDKNTFIVWLVVRADGTKLPAVIIFRASNKKRGFIRINHEKFGIPKEVIVGGSLNGWWNERLDYMWIDQTYKEDEDLLEGTVQFEISTPSTRWNRARKSWKDMMWSRLGLRAVSQSNKRLVFQ